MTTEPLLYVYAVVRSSPDGPPPTAGGPAAALGSGLVTVARDGLTAVAEEVGADRFEERNLRESLEDLAFVTAVARAHHEVVEAVGRTGTTVPLRLATVCRGRAGVARLLRTGHDRFTEALDQVDGAREWGVKLYAEEATARPAVPAPAGHPDAAEDGATGPGRGYLRRRVRERRADDQRTETTVRAARNLHHRLTALVAGAALHPPQDGRLSGRTGRNVLNAAYLVPVAEEREFLDAVPSPGDLPAGLRAEVTGPWVPYTFTGNGADAETESGGETDGVR
jgi:hypothetical protein